VFLVLAGGTMSPKHDKKSEDDSYRKQVAKEKKQIEKAKKKEERKKKRGILKAERSRARRGDMY
jgi:hypothetical protein